MYEASSYKLIYIFSIPDEAHKGLVKVGEATIHTSKTLEELQPNCDALREAASERRIKEYTFTAGIKVDLHWAELAILQKKENFKGVESTIIQSFHDYKVHNVLKNSGISVSYPNGIKNKEWFACSVDVAKNAIKAVKENRAFLSESDRTILPKVEEIELREEQRNAVEKTLNVFKTGNEMLWNCKMRFGKTLTAYELIRSGKYQKTIVVTHRPVVEQGWNEDHGKLFGKDSKHIFMKKQGLIYSEDYCDYDSDIKNDVALKNAKANGDYFTYFASMQDLRGSKEVGGKFDKNKAVFAMDWDLIIYDEAHEGTQTDLGKRVQNLLEYEKEGKKPKVLELSGTPYNIMEKYEDNVYTWDYVMEQRAKEEWPYKHPDEPNPYEDMPKMNIFTFDMSNALVNSYRYVTDKQAFNFREFFRVWTGDIERDFRQVPRYKEIGDFVHEEDVISFLNIISTESCDTKYPFATDDFRKEFKHTFWIVPGVKEAYALSKLLKKHPVFSQYQIANVAGEGDEELPYDNALNLVKECIAKNEYTITISCGKLTTGVTVKEWTAVMMLTGNIETDAKAYMQTIFRVQSAGVINGKQKENCYVFDFAPDRALRVIADAHSLSKKGKTKDKQFKQELALFLNFCPIIGIEGTKMQKYDENRLMREIKRISVDSALKSGFDDESIYKVDTGIVMDKSDMEFFEALKSRLNSQKKAKQETKIKVADNGMTEGEFLVAKKAEHKPKDKLTPEEKEALEKLKAQRKQREHFIALLRNIAIRLPLLIYGADVPLTEDISMEKFTEIVDDESWKEFLPNDVSKDLFRRSIKYFDEDVLIGAGLRIRKLVKQADEYPVTERIKRITEIFSHFRNPDKETVLTPWKVVNMHLSNTIGGYTFLDDKFDANAPLDKPRYVDNGDVTKDLFDNANSKILEINSKSGLYPLYCAYTLYRKRLIKLEDEYTLEEQYGVWNKVLEDNIYVLCKTTMAKKITQRTLAGFTNSKTNTHYQAHLLEKMQSDMDWVVRKIKTPAVWGKEGEIKMRFDAVVGNPPYQEIVNLATNGNNNNTIDIYQYFKDLSLKIANKITLIYPAKDLQRGKENLLNNNLIKVRIYNGSDKDTEKNIPGEPSVFGAAVRRIPGDVGVYLWDNEKPTKDIIYQNEIIERTDKIMPVRKEFFGLAKDLSICANSSKDYSIRKCCESDFVEKNPKSILSEISDRLLISPSGYTKVITNNKAGSGGKAHWYYIKTSELDYKQPNVYKVVISSAFPNEAFKNPNNVEILNNDEMFGRTRMCIYYSDKKDDVYYFVKYLKTKFVRIIAEMTPYKFMYYLPDFNLVKDSIDWTKSISEIDNQLYVKYNLTQDEIDFIESSIKQME